jgi:hypothetical protein
MAVPLPDSRRAAVPKVPVTVRPGPADRPCGAPRVGPVVGSKQSCLPRAVTAPVLIVEDLQPAVDGNRRVLAVLACLGG